MLGIKEDLTGNGPVFRFIHELGPIFVYLHYSSFFPPQLKRHICALAISHAHSTFLTNHREAS